MSGLLPRTSGQVESGNFTDLTAQTLVVNGTGFISNLTTAVFSVGQLETTDLLSATDLTISTGGAPRLTIPAAGIVLDNTATDVLALNGADELVYVNDLVDLTSAQTLTNKTLTAPVISIISNGGTLTLPTGANTIVARATTDTLTNKTLTAPLVSGQVIQTANQQDPYIIDQLGVTTSNGLLFRENGTDIVGFGSNSFDPFSYIWTYANRPFRIATNNAERLRIAAGGIANDNSITNILGLNGTTLAYKNDVVDTSTAQTLSNKTFATAPALFGGKIVQQTGTTTTAAAGDVTLVTVPFATSDTTSIMDVYLESLATAGGLVGQSAAQILRLKVRNAAGVMASANISNQNSNDYATGLGLTFTGTTANVKITGIALSTIRWTAYVTTYYE